MEEREESEKRFKLFFSLHLKMCEQHIWMQKHYFVHNQRSALTVPSRCFVRFWNDSWVGCRTVLVGCPHVLYVFVVLQGVLHTCVMVPDVAVEDFSQNVEDTNHHSHRTEEDDSSQGSNALQHRVHPHTCHMVHPTRPGPEKLKVTMPLEQFLDTIYLPVLKIKPILTRDNINVCKNWTAEVNCQ